MPSKKTHIIVPVKKATQPAVQPKLSKTELIQALALRMKQQDEEYNAPINVEIDAIDKQMEEEMLNKCREHLKQIVEQGALGKGHVGYQSWKANAMFQVVITLSPTPRYESLREKRRDLCIKRVPVHEHRDYIQVARDQIYQKTDRVPELMKNKDFIKGLDTTLKALRDS